MQIRYIVKCPNCRKQALTSAKPKKQGSFIHKAVICKSCMRVMVHTGECRKHYSLQELL